MEEIDFSRAVWRKSSRSSGNGNCFEWSRLHDGSVGVRDSKLGDASPVLRFTVSEWEAFVGAVKAGEAD